jgi:tRNA-splicing ligase RtcB
MIHTGSRGFGYQICEDYLKDFIKAASKYKIDLLDRQLACAPIVSPEGQAYLNAMKCAANFAWNNRQVIMELSRRAIKKALSISDNELGFQLLYDVSHNIAKIEVHEIEGERKKVCVHRKGATRAFPKNSPYISKDFEDIGQPVLIPGDMGRYSFVLVGTEEALKETFGSSCHGAGRVMSRNKAIELAKGRDIAAELSKKGIIVKAKAKATLAEEMPEAYKDARLVVDIAHYANIAKKVARLKPIGVIKG